MTSPPAAEPVSNHAWLRAQVLALLVLLLWPWPFNDRLNQRLGTDDQMAARVAGGRVFRRRADAPSRLQRAG